MEKYSEIRLREVVENSKTFREVLHEFGRNESGASYKTLHRRFKEWNISTEHFLNRSELMILMRENGINNFDKKKSNDEIFGINNISRNTVKTRIIAENLIEYKCKFCENDGFWNGVKISLILDHINGINNDNHLENMRFLCPNCNATLETHCKGSKGLIKKEKKIRKCPPRFNNRKVKERPSIDELNEMMKTMSYRAVGRKYGVSDNSIRKWINQYNNKLKMPV